MSIYRGGQEIKELRFGGTQKIKEAYVGGQLVFKGGWDAVPSNGIICDKSGIYADDYTGIGGTAGNWRINNKASAYINNVVFGENTTQFTMTRELYPGDSFIIYIDDVQLGSIGGNTSKPTSVRAIPAQYCDGQPHTIRIYNSSSSNQFFISLAFDV